MTIRVIINGVNGRMGQTAKRTIAHQKNLLLVGEGTRDTSLAELIQQQKADVVIDFTTPESVFNNTKIIIENNAHPVIGTTGLTEPQIDTLKKMCEEKKLGGIIAPNFSLSAVLMMKYAKEAAQYFDSAEIIEMHHDQKKDAPSGTAIKTEQLMNRKTPIHSVRLPGLFSHQIVIFGGQNETLSIRHDALDREAMMPGLFVACQKVLSLDHLIYGLENLL